MNDFQFSLCRELGCVESSIRDPTKVPRVREYSLRYSALESSLINYARVKYLREGDFKSILKNFHNGEIVSVDNEISATLA
jgi:hypothetical protein